MTVFGDRLLSASSKDLRLSVSIDGVPLAFTAGFAGSAPIPPTYDGRGMLVSVEEGRTVLDRQQRMQIGGGATIIVQDRDGILRDLFSSRSFAVAFLAASATSSSSTVTLSTLDGLPASGVVYVGAETIRYSVTALAPPRLLFSVRGEYGSPRQAHRGGADYGAPVFTRPPTWLGRRVRLTGTFNNDDGVPDAGTTQTLATYRLEASPIDLGDGRYELRCSHLSDEILKKKVGTGVEEIRTPGAKLSFDRVGGEMLLKLTTAKGVGNLCSQGTRPSQLIMHFSKTIQYRAMFDIYDVDTAPATTDVIRVRALPISTSGDSSRLAALLDEVSGIEDLSALGESDAEIDFIKHVAVIEGTWPNELMLNVLMSRVGNGENTFRDTLGGRVATSVGGPGFQFGAGILAAEIANLTFTRLPTYRDWSTVIDEEIPLVEVTSDFCRQSNTALVISATGQLTLISMIDGVGSAPTSITEAHVKGKITSTIAEGDVFTRATVECNYDPIDAKYEATINVIDEVLAATYAPVEASLVIRSRSIVVAPVDTTGLGSLVRPEQTRSELLTQLRRTMLDSRGGALVLTFRADARHLELQLGDLVGLSMPSVSDRRGGTLASAKARIVERQPDWSTLDVDLTVIVEEPVSVFAPFVVVLTADAVSASADQRITFDMGALGQAPTVSLAPDDRMRVYDPVNNVFVGAGVNIFTSTFGALTVFNVDSMVPSLPLSVGWVLLLAQSVDLAPDGFLNRDYAWMDGSPDFDSTIISRWR